MNPWIILGIIVWLALGFVGRCMMKALWIKNDLRGYWTYEELLADASVLLGPCFLTGAIFVVVIASRAAKKSLWGLKF